MTTIAAKAKMRARRAVLRQPHGEATVKIVMALSTILSFAPYIGEPSATLMALPVIVLTATALVIISARWENFIKQNWAFLICVALFVIFSVLAVYHGVDKESDQELEVAQNPFAIIALVTALMLDFRILSDSVSPKAVVEGFAYGGAGSLLLYVYMSGFDVFRAHEVGERLAGFNFHPNLLAFCCATFASSAAFLFDRRSRIKNLIAFATIAVGCVIIFQTSSRGSLIAILVGTSVSGPTCFRMLFGKKMRSAGSFITLVVAAFCIASAIFLIGISDKGRLAFEGLVTSISGHLELDSVYRGVGSGMSGRVDIWELIWQIFGWKDYLIGVGMRHTHLTVGDIDNSYFVLLLENGVIATGVICGLWVARIREYRFAITREINALAATLMLGTAIVILSNNIVARYLIAVGNPGSLFAIAILVMPFRNWSSSVSYTSVTRLRVKGE
jgi:hypothetical protein